MIRRYGPALTLLVFWFRRVLPMWSLIAAMIFLIQLAVCGIVHDNQNIKALVNFLNVLPPIMKAALGGETLQVGNVSALIGIGYQHPLVLILYMIFAVGVPTGCLVGETQRGTMELILSRSVTKTQAYACAGWLTIAGMFALALVMYLGTVAGTTMYRFDAEVPLDRFFRVAINGGALAATVGAIALFVAACFQRRSRAIMITVSYLVVNFFMALVSQWWPWLRPLAPYNLFYYVKGPRIFREPGWPVHDLAVLGVILVVAVVAGGLIWRRRDLPA